MSDDLKHIVHLLGKSELQKALGLKHTAVSVALFRGHFPPAWYPTIKRLAAEKGIEVPDHLFNWRRPEDVVPAPGEPTDPVTDNPTSPVP